MLTREEFSRLQNLSALSLDENQTIKLGKQLGNIVDFLSQLQKIGIDSSDTFSTNHYLIPTSGVCSYQDSQNLFVNVKHEKIGNSLVISSVVDN